MDSVHASCATYDPSVDIFTGKKKVFFFCQGLGLGYAKISGILDS